MIQIKLLFNELSYKDKWFVILSFFYILYNIFPLFEDISHIPVTYPGILIISYCFVKYPKVFSQNNVKWLYLYIFMLILYSTVRYTHINGLSSTLPAWWRITIETAWILPALVITNVLLKKRDVKIFKIIGFGTIFALIMSFVYILPMLMANSNILREDLMNMEAQRPIGLPDYTLMHSYAYLLTPLYFNVRRSKGKKMIIALIIAIFFSYIVIRTSVTTSLFAILFNVIFTLFISEKNWLKTFIAFFILSILFIFIYHSGLLLSFVDALMPFFEGTAVSYKLQDFHDSLIVGHITGDSLTSRTDHHKVSIDSFLQNPFFGGGFVEGHSKVLDILGCMGILGFIPFIMIYISTLKSYLHIISSKSIKVFLIISFLIGFVYMYQKGIFGCTGWLFMMVLVPSLFICYDKNQ